MQAVLDVKVGSVVQCSKKGKMSCLEILEDIRQHQVESLIPNCR